MYAELVEACGGLEHIRKLRDHNDNSIADAARAILEIYFTNEENSAASNNFSFED